ncbi:MAG: hypothetical protein ABI758_03330 [Candidatus Woesebacteria bacterium]
MRKYNINSSEYIRRNGRPVKVSIEGKKVLTTFDELELKSQEIFAHPLIILLTKRRADELVHFSRVMARTWIKNCAEFREDHYSELLIFVFNDDEYKVSTRG